MNRKIVRRRKPRRLYIYSATGGGATVSLKGMAFLCAVDVGLVPYYPEEDVYDDGPFLRFWEEFSKFLHVDIKGYPNELQTVAEMLKKERDG